MVEHRDNALIFGRYTREECGLPPEGWDGGRGPGFARALVLVAVLAAVAWGAGVLSARLREEWTGALFARIAAAPENAPALLARGKMYAAALPERKRMRCSLALAALTAAEKAPRRLGFYANAANLFSGVEGEFVGPPAVAFGFAIMAAGVHGELEEYGSAFAELKRAEDALERIDDADTARKYRLVLVNARAYFLACAGPGQGGNPERALELAGLMITSRDELPNGGAPSGSAAFLDTLATARHATGDRAGAAAAQTLALGLADSDSLDAYLRHYDAFREEESLY